MKIGALIFDIVRHLIIEKMRTLNAEMQCQCKPAKNCLMCWMECVDDVDT